MCSDGPLALPKSDTADVGRRLDVPVLPASADTQPTDRSHSIDQTAPDCWQKQHRQQDTSCSVECDGGHQGKKGCLEDGADVPDTASPVDLEGLATPPKQGACGDDALAALIELQKAFGEEPVSDAACSSITVLVPPSPISVGSSSCAASPEGKISTAASSGLGGAAEVAIAREVPGFSGGAT